MLLQEVDVCVMRIAKTGCEWDVDAFFGKSGWYVQKRVLFEHVVVSLMVSWLGCVKPGWRSDCPIAGLGRRMVR